MFNGGGSSNFTQAALQYGKGGSASAAAAIAAVCEESQARFDAMEFEQPPPLKHQKTTAVTMEDLKELLLVQTKGFADVLTATSSTANACNNLVQVITMQMQQAAALAKQRSDELDSSGVHHFPRVGQQSQTHPSQALQEAAPIANAVMVATQIA
jgi:hypothetical protein